ncbi:MAG: HlyD family efflux transporter periplasmic adaptor subunit [Lachnospiraceae bacterium]|nr:HlyD family efflux transporter periplasmic adaptor subunit [Lachnospiraceae bacterium]
MNTEKNSNRKEWIKNAAIIFLSVMLVLTFFSNTIMNYSLPEVATAMIEPGSINAKIRGTGNLTSDNPYKITIQESRTIASVAVKQGDVVEKDQVLFYLEDEDSQELEEAEKALDELLLAYSSSILNGGISQQAYENIQGGKVSSTAQYQERINAAKQKVADAQTTVENLEKQIKLEQNGTVGEIDKNAELKTAELKLEEYGKRKSDAENAVKAKKAEIASIVVTGADVLNNELNAAVLDEGIKKAAYEAARKDFYEVIKDSPDSTRFPEEEQGTICFEANISNTEYMQNIAKRAQEVDAGVADDDKKAVEQLTVLQKAYSDYIEAQGIRVKAQAAIDNVSDANVKKTQLQNELAELERQYAEISEKYNKKQTEIKNLTNQIKENDTNKEMVLLNLNQQLIVAMEAKTKAQEELDQLLKDISSELNLGNQNSIIREQREKIAKLREEAVGAVITAPVAGTVTTLNKIAGEKITPNEDLAILQPEGKGFSMSFSVTPEQAKKVTVGEQAEIQNSWFYNDITATLVGIRPDPESNGAKKLLVFDVKGDVQAGQSVSLSIGQRSASYDLLVPNSAVREDNNGKFILIVEAKNSPLGNRYIATRIDVEVLGADDNKTAISAPLYGYEYVITTSTQPVEAGKQVRLAEN